MIRRAVELLAQELLGSYVTDSSHGDVGVSEVADVINSASDAEVGQKHPAPVAIRCGHEDVLRLDVTMEQTAIMTTVFDVPFEADRNGLAPGTSRAAPRATRGWT